MSGSGEIACVQDNEVMDVVVPKVVRRFNPKFHR